MQQVAFPFYYASISVFAYLAVKNNFDEEKYAWIEAFRRHVKEGC